MKKAIVENPPAKKVLDPVGKKLALHLLKEENKALRELIEKQQQKIKRLERRGK